MLIGIDGNEANVDRRVGVHQYAYELLWSFYRMKKEKRINDDFEIYLKSDKKNDLPPEIGGWKYKKLTGKGLWVLTKLTPYLLLNKKVDVFFTPSHYLPLSFTVPKVFTIHDLGYLKDSGQFRKYDFWQLKYWTAISVFISKYIIAVSKSTKKDIVRQYKFASDKVEVVYHGYDKNKFNTHIPHAVVRRVTKEYKLSKNYILFLGTLKPSKNISNLLEAFKEISLKNPKIQLVVAGKKGWLYDEIYSKAIELELHDKVVFTDYVDERDKPALLKGAKVYVIPSLWEGFGMDILHAMACGTPVVASNIASIPEVGGDAAVYCDPLDSKSIEEGIKSVLEMADLEYNKLVASGLQQVKKFSWERSAIKTLKVIQKAAQK